MPGTLTPTQMFEHNLNVVKGPTLMHRLDYSALVDTDGLADGLVEGMLMSISSTTGKVVRGCGVGSAANRPMPMWAIQGVNDYDANSDVGNISGGVMSGIVATGGFEIETTEFDSTATYYPNDLLVPSGTTAGYVTLAVAADLYDEKPIVGCVSKAKFTSLADGKTLLSFWTMFLPATA